MPSIDIGICFSKCALLDGKCETEKTLCAILNTLIQKDDITFTSAYLYDERSDQRTDVFDLKDFLRQIMRSNFYNRITFKSGENDLFVTIGLMKHDLTVGLNLDYEFFSDILQKTTPISLRDLLQRRFYDLYEEIPCRFAFADFDTEFDHSYFELLKMEKEGNAPYCLLVIDDNGSLKTYRSSYDLLGCPYEDDP